MKKEQMDWRQTWRKTDVNRQTSDQPHLTTWRQSWQLRDKASYRSVSGLTGTGSSRWSGSPVPALAGEVVIRSEPTGSPVWTGYPVEMSSQGVIVDLVS